MQRWNTVDFDSLSWHDNHVYSVSVRAAEDRRSELVLDLDFILEWLKPVNEKYRYRIAPATLTFHDVSELQISLSNPGGPFPLCPFSIDGLEREEKIHPNGYRTFSWFIGLNCPGGDLSFEASRLLISTGLRVESDHSG